VRFSGAAGFLDRMSILDVVATDNAAVLGKVRGAADDAETARNTAAEAQKRARDAADSAQRAVDEVRGLKANSRRRSRTSGG
jgi:hypothetical protein